MEPVEDSEFVPPQRSVSFYSPRSKPLLTSPERTRVAPTPRFPSTPSASTPDARYAFLAAQLAKHRETIARLELENRALKEEATGAAGRIAALESALAAATAATDAERARVQRLVAANERLRDAKQSSSAPFSSIPSGDAPSSGPASPWSSLLGAVVEELGRRAATPEPPLAPVPAVTPGLFFRTLKDVRDPADVRAAAIGVSTRSREEFISSSLGGTTIPVADARSSPAVHPDAVRCCTSSERATHLGELLASGSLLADATVDGQPLLHIAGRAGNKKAVKALLRAGANLNAVNADGKTARDLCEELGHRELADYLASKGGASVAATPVTSLRRHAPSTVRSSRPEGVFSPTDGARARAAPPSDLRRRIVFADPVEPSPSRRLVPGSSGEHESENTPARAPTTAKIVRDSPSPAPATAGRSGPQLRWL